jgi:hypothetical protein
LPAAPSSFSSDQGLPVAASSSAMSALTSSSSSFGLKSFASWFIQPMHQSASGVNASVRPIAP